jgi:8-oxo-dGTP pyrophosphatase MutT (NUDIX family)
MIKDPHPIQLLILKKLLFAPSLRYTELKPNPDLENNQFDFHLDQLIKASYIIKQANLYLLTSTGKEFANSMDTDQVKIVKQAKISVFVASVKSNKKATEFLIYTRLKQPFYGKQGFLSGKVLYGETVEQAAEREFNEETGLTGKPKTVALHHYLVYEKTTHKLIEDKFMFLCLIKNPKGNLIGSNEGKYEWVKTPNLLTYVTNHFENKTRFKKDIKQILEFKGDIVFEEITHLTNDF